MEKLPINKTNFTSILTWKKGHIILSVEYAKSLQK